jgi:hypothetical protein
MSQEVKTLIKIAAEISLKESFVEGFNTPTPERLLDALGIAICHYCDYTGLDILKVMYSALEDANYHRYNETVQKWIDEEEGR